MKTQTGATILRCSFFMGAISISQSAAADDGHNEAGEFIIDHPTLINLAWNLIEG